MKSSQPASIICSITLFALATLLLLIEAQAATERGAKTVSPYGVWEHPKGKTRVDIRHCGEKLCGKIIWLKKPLRNGKPKVDRKNSNKALRNRKVIGLDIFHNMKFDIYNPDDGGEYNGYISFISPQKAKIQGCWFIFCKTQIWTRVSSSALPPKQ